MEYQSTLQVINLDEPVFDDLTFGNPIWPQWDIYSPYDLLPTGLAPSALAMHLEAPETFADEPEMAHEEPSMPAVETPLPAVEPAPVENDSAGKENDSPTPHDDMMQSP